jgi:pyruvate,water dikinase
VLSELSSALNKYIPATSEKIIVRSSASVEDSIRTSFAGQFVSAVVPNSDEDLIAGLKQCWKAIASPSLAAYAQAMRVRLSATHFAFLIQQFIEFEYSGVLFTRLPNTSNKGDYLVEYAEGGAHQVVAGHVIPARCRLVRGTESVEWLSQPIHVSRLADRTLLQLGRLATKAKQVFSSDQDIEWGLAGSDLFLLQSRPITG